MKKFWIILAGIMAGGIAYWFQPYNQSTMLGINIWLIMSTGVFITVFLLKLLSNDKPNKIALLVSSGVILAVFARIVYDVTFWDSTSHNLAPFEIVICAFVVLPVAFAGAYLPSLVKRLRQ